ncbi:MAG: hypothetical protein ACRCYY_18230 [Trueperaceae bacterium]
MFCHKSNIFISKFMTALLEGFFFQNHIGISDTTLSDTTLADDN